MELSTVYCIHFPHEEHLVKWIIIKTLLFLYLNKGQLTDSVQINVIQIVKQSISLFLSGIMKTG